MYMHTERLLHAPMIKGITHHRKFQVLHTYPINSRSANMYALAPLKFRKKKHGGQGGVANWTHEQGVG